MSAYQNLPWETDIFLSLSGIPSTGILYNQITVKYKKYGATSFTTRVLNNGDLVELGDGFYTLLWSDTFTNVIGTFMYTLSNGALFDNFLYDTFDVEPQPLVLSAPPDTCIVSGNITDIGGNPAHNLRISFRVPEFPLVIGNTIIDANKVYTLPDVFGNFSVGLIQGQTVIVEVERAGIYVQIVIPFAPSANLSSLLPP
jgi:hypothetical protein